MRPQRGRQKIKQKPGSKWMSKHSGALQGRRTFSAKSGEKLHTVINEKDRCRERESVRQGGQKSLFRDPPSGFLPEETPEENLSSKFSQTVEQSDILNFYGDRQFSQHVIRFNVVCITASMEEPGIGQDHKSGTLSAHSTCSFLTLCVKESRRDPWCD